MSENKTLKDDKAYWSFVEKTAKEVDSWPDWKRGGSVNVYREEVSETKPLPKEKNEK